MNCTPDPFLCGCPDCRERRGEIRRRKPTESGLAANRAPLIIFGPVNVDDVSAAKVAERAERRR
jgi:hypothetical protein